MEMATKIMERKFCQSPFRLTIDFYSHRNWKWPRMPLGILQCQRILPLRSKSFQPSLFFVGNWYIWFLWLGACTANEDRRRYRCNWNTFRSEWIDASLWYNPNSWQLSNEMKWKYWPADTLGHWHRTQCTPMQPSTNLIIGLRRLSMVVEAHHMRT